MEISSLAIDITRYVVDSPDTVGNLASAANYVRFLLPQLLPHLHHILYLDIDILVKNDISEIWYYLMTSKKMMVAVPRYILHDTILCRGCRGICGPHCFYFVSYCQELNGELGRHRGKEGVGFCINECRVSNIW